MTITSAQLVTDPTPILFNILGPALHGTFMIAAQSSNSFDVIDFWVLMQLCTAYNLHMKIHKSFASLFNFHNQRR